jgi:hypothetical protein
VDTTRIKQGDPKNTRPEIDLPPEPLAGLLLVISGTTASGENLTPSRCGRVRIQRFSEQIQGENVEFYHDLANINRGYPTNEGGTNAASRIAVPIPFGLNGIPNVLDVQSNEEADAVLDFTQGDLGTAFGSNSATYELIGLVAPTVAERYVLRVQESNLQASGAGRQPGEFNAKNVASIYLRDSSSVVDEVQIGIDGDVVQDTLSDEIIQDLTNLYNEVETSGLDLRQVHKPDVMSLGRTLNARCSYDVKFSGAGTAEFTLLSTRFNNKRIEQSAERVQRVQQAKRQEIAADLQGVPSGAVR